jgi:metal-responsive CopG/Arc/MetJ family transcriptional regulator
MKTQVPVMIDVELLMQVEDFLYKNRMKNRSKFICDLVRENIELKNKMNKYSK